MSLVLWMSLRSGWITLIITIALALSVSANNKKNETTNAAPAINGTTQDEVDDFVPFQGERFNSFDWGLLRNLASSNRGNVLLSPISVKMGLVLLYEGSQDETAEEIATAMRLPGGRSETRDKFTQILKSLEEKKPEYSLNFGTKIYIDNTITTRKRFKSIAKSFYNTEVLDANFTDTKNSSININNFVKNITNGHIDNIVDDESKLKDSVMMIVNAIYFEGTWQRQPFLLNETKINKFHLDDMKTTVDVPFMRASNKFYYVYAKEIDSKILRIPYAGRKYAMYVVLPKGPGKMDELLKTLTPFFINKNLWLMQELPIDVMLPKFKFDFTSHLEDTLRAMGIREIFDDTAKLTNILLSRATSRRLRVTDILQKAGISVNECGTVAYAASKVEIGNKINDETFHANHPFLFYIEDESSGSILYMGIVNNPLEETGIVDTTTASPSQTQKPSIDIFVELPPRVGEDSDSTKINTTLPPAGPIFGTSVDERQNFFNIELLQQLNGAQQGNVFVGLSSVKTALMILAEATAGRTRQQIVSSLRLPADPKEIRQLAGSIVSPLKDTSSKTTELETAVKLWLTKELPLLLNFRDVLKMYYKGELETVNFKDVTATVKTINDWVKKHTHGRIDSIVDSGLLSPETRLLLTTAVYFKGMWLNTFEKNQTQSRCFNALNGACRDVQMMEVVADFKYNYVPALDAQVISIPYTGKQVTMLVFLPKRQGESALNDLSRDLAFIPISAILSSLEETEVLLQLPKFSINNKLTLRILLERLGILDLFDNNANFSSAFPRSTVQVSEILHNAQIEVNEEGTVATAVTGASVIPLMGSTLTYFRADRPFIFMILDLQTNGILFAGRFTQPEAAKPAAKA